MCLLEMPDVLTTYRFDVLKQVGRSLDIDQSFGPGRTSMFAVSLSVSNWQNAVWVSCSVAHEA